MSPVDKLMNETLVTPSKCCQTGLCNLEFDFIFLISVIQMPFGDEIRKSSLVQLLIVICFESSLKDRQNGFNIKMRMDVKRPHIKLWQFLQPQSVTILSFLL